MSDGKCYVVHVFFNDKLDFAGVFEDMMDAHGYLKSNKLLGTVQPTVMIKKSNDSSLTKTVR